MTIPTRRATKKKKDSDDVTIRENVGLQLVHFHVDLSTVPEGSVFSR